MQRPGRGDRHGHPATRADPTAKLDGVKLTIWAAQNSNTVPKKGITSGAVK